MAMPKKGSRSIIIDGVPYRWQVRGRVYNKDGVVCIEPVTDDGNICKLLVDTSAPFPNGCPCCEQYPAITPSTVEQYVRVALQLGWQPIRKDKPFVYVAEKVSPIRSGWQ
jgi:hypothetical protein